MCGIAGFFGQHNIADLDVLKRMTESQAHRGPNGAGHYFESLDGFQVALGHRRLSILDVSQLANQPMMYEHLVIVYNGEVYNYSEIRDLLCKEGYSFDSDGDTEVVLKAFHCWGANAVNHFRGMFSFCILDKKAKKVYLFRDRVGVKPFYYSHANGNLIFSSELKSFHFHPHFRKTICNVGLRLFFQNGYISAPWTIFENTKKIKPGHFLEYDLTKDVLVEKNYWNLAAYYLHPKSALSEEEAIQKLEKILLDSFTLRLISDVPVGVLLSGGIDSSLVAAILQSNSSRSIDTFTMGFSNQDYDESQSAKKIANYLGTNHHEQYCSWKDAELAIAWLPKMYDEPFADSSAIPTALISQFAKQKVTVALSGDGGDEMFCGYAHYQLSERRFRAINKIPFKKGVNKLLNFIPDPIMNLYNMNFDKYNRYLKFKSVFSQLNTENQYKMATQTFTTYDIKQLFESQNSFYFATDSFPNLNQCERMMLVDFNYYLPDDLMVKVDRATMYHSLEGREPLLDHKILEFAAQLPISLKKDKFILKKILSKYLPKAYFERKKHGFGVPVNQWLKKELRYLMDKYFDVEKIKKQGLFNAHYISKLSNAFLKSQTNDNRIWTLLMFQMWYEEYMDAIF